MHIARGGGNRNAPGLRRGSAVDGLDGRVDRDKSGVGFGVDGRASTDGTPTIASYDRMMVSGLAAT